MLFVSYLTVLILAHIIQKVNTFSDNFEKKMKIFWAVLECLFLLDGWVLQKIPILFSSPKG